MSMVRIEKKWGPLYTESRFKDTKDPCPVFDGERWHIFGSGGSVRDEKWKILHAIAPALEGPWVEEDPVQLLGLTGDHVAAPGVIYEHGTFHMFVQTDFLATAGTVEYLTSSDGCTFTRINTALQSIPDTEEAGIYDPHPSIINGKKYLVYSGTPRVLNLETHFVSRPDIFLAESEGDTWEGPWIRRGKILDHHAIAEHHNHPDSPEYEWGIEGPQLVGLPNGNILLNATCFLPSGRFGTRQRTFFAIANDVHGPYQTLGPVLEKNMDTWESGENGHAACVLVDEALYLFYQARSQTNAEDVQANDWRYGIASFDIAPLVQERMPSRLFPAISRIKWREVMPYALFKTVRKVLQDRLATFKKKD
jgi:hypothetical protein